jgi:hypothetical protein
MFVSAATHARFGWINFRPSSDAAAQMQRRVRREADEAMIALNASYPTIEWFNERFPPLPPSPSRRESSTEAYGRVNQAPKWIMRLRRYFWA